MRILGRYLHAVRPFCNTRIFSMRGRQLAERGDTLIEVLLAIAVVSVVLTGAYITTNHSLQDTRAAQERGDALKVVETQLEELRSLAGTTNSPVFTQTGQFCIYNTTTIYPATAAQCAVNASGIATSGQPAYHIAISENTSTNTFTISDWWYNVTGGYKDQMQLEYRLYQ